MLSPWVVCDPSRANFGNSLTLKSYLFIDFNNLPLSYVYVAEALFSSHFPALIAVFVLRYRLHRSTHNRKSPKVTARPSCWNKKEKSSFDKQKQTLSRREPSQRFPVFSLSLSSTWMHFISIAHLNASRVRWAVYFSFSFTGWRRKWTCPRRG